MAEKKKDKNYYTSREAAELLQVAVSTIQLWTDNGLLHAWTTVGGHRRIEKQSVENMLFQNKKDACSKDVDHKLSIVVVEDNPQEMSLYEQHFEIWQLPANLFFSKDGYAGLLNIGKYLPDIIITDLMMPNINGFEMIKAIRENSSLNHCLIIAVSALTHDEINIRGGLPEDVIVFNKPMPFDKLEYLIRQQESLDVNKLA